MKERKKVQNVEKTKMAAYIKKNLEEITTLKRKKRKINENEKGKER